MRKETNERIRMHKEIKEQNDYDSAWCWTIQFCKLWLYNTIHSIGPMGKFCLRWLQRKKNHVHPTHTSAHSCTNAYTCAYTVVCTHTNTHTHTHTHALSCLHTSPSHKQLNAQLIISFAIFKIHVRWEHVKLHILHMLYVHFYRCDPSYSCHINSK